jgi:ectoine hydroxylase-related dioxygenase (phytanoyl-CoA dioxygenase family)
VDLAAIRDAYDRDGHATVVAAVGASTVAAALEHLGGMQSRRAGPSAVVTAPLQAEPFFDSISRHRRLQAIASALLRAPARAFACSYVVKAPRIGLPALWHQDGHPWRTTLGIRDAVTLWLALDAADAHNGCLRVIPGSHRTPPRPLRPNVDVPSIFGVELEPGLVDSAGAVDVVLDPGDVSAHHPALVHGSEPNRSERPRRALALRYRAA